MVKFAAASVFVAACFLGFTSTAQASTIASECIDLGTGNYHCDLVEGSANGVATDPEYARADFLGAGWLVGYTFVLENGTTYSGAGDNGNISDVVVIHNDYFELFSQGHADFNSAIAAALALTPIDGIALVNGQIVGTPFFPGAQQNGGVGLVNEALNGSAQLLDISFAAGQGDSVSVNPVDGTAVPEPATLTLVGLGGAVAAYRRRRKTA